MPAGIRRVRISTAILAGSGRQRPVSSMKMRCTPGARSRTLIMPPAALDETCASVDMTCPNVHRVIGRPQRYLEEFTVADRLQFDPAHIAL